MVLLDRTSKQNITWEFEGEVYSIQNPHPLKNNFQGVIYTNFVKQVAKIITLQLDQLDLLIKEERGIIRFRFISSPEYLHLGSEFIFRQGRTKAIGIIKATFPIEETSYK